ncbi:hypothetical protein PR048_027369 [Dryococelus australis]|uniref:Fibronectin type-III domain-containing protein n=1 Tax=Dryococelus australis TaxID=614101 RepID=A0ABQ9GF97_9NEOP|nr:hypothetical protein PR048_027369 [Dryococelus australis]
MDQGRNARVGGNWISPRKSADQLQLMSWFPRPDNIGDLNVSEVTAHGALVTWKQSSSNCTDHYVLGWCATDYPDEPCNPTRRIRLNTTVTEYNITSLEPCSYNIISIRTSAADGRSSNSRREIVKTLLDEPFIQAVMQACIESSEESSVVAYRLNEREMYITVDDAKLSNTYSALWSMHIATVDAISIAGCSRMIESNPTGEILFPADEFGPSTHVTLTAFSARLFSLEYRPASNAALCTAGYTGCFREAGSSGEPVCIPTSNLQYWSNYDNATRACTQYNVNLTSLSNDNRTWSTSMSFTSRKISPAKVWSITEIQGRGKLYIPEKTYRPQQKCECTSTPVPAPEEVLDLQVRNGTTGPNGSSVLFTWRVSPDNGCMSHQHLNCSRVEVMGNDHTFTVLWSTGANFTNNVTEFEIRDLEPCAAYTVNVFQEPTPPDPIPTEILFNTASNVTSVTYVKVLGSDDSSVNISYLAPEVSPRCVSKYSVCWRQTTADTDTCHTRTGSGVHDVSIQGLTNCTQYTLSVTPVAPNDERYTAATLTTTTTGCSGNTSYSSTTNAPPTSEYQCYNMDSQ